MRLQGVKSGSWRNRRVPQLLTEAQCVLQNRRGAFATGGEVPRLLVEAQGVLAEEALIQGGGLRSDAPCAYSAAPSGEYLTDICPLLLLYEEWNSYPNATPLYRCQWEPFGA